MNAIQSITAPVHVLDISNIDTDQIIPARFLTTTQREGLGKHAFNDWRYQADGSPKPDFFLNRHPSDQPLILLAADNFGCGSSREHAPWALLDAGIRAVISTRIADIFRSNSLKNGLLSIVVTPEQWQALHDRAAAPLTIDLQAEVIRAGDLTVPFKIDGFARACLLDGVDELGYLLKRADLISAFEARRAA